MLKEVRGFAHFEQLCLKLGFKKTTPGEARERLRQADKRSRRPQEGKETGFEFSAENGLKVVVWTTYLEEKGEFRGKDTDVGWVLIIQNGKAVHFSRPAPRTKNFLLNLYRRVWINWCRVSNRPSCPECGKYMDIKRGRHLKQRYWNCEQWKLHNAKGRHTLDFNFALPPEAKKWTEKMYRKRKKYIARVKKTGKQPHTAMLKRKKWMPAKLETSKS